MFNRHKMARIPWVSYVVVIFGGVIMVVPFLDLVFSSLKAFSEYGRLPYHLVPQHFTWSNYLTAFQSLQLGKLFSNSVIVSVSVTALVLLTSAMAGYALAKLRFHGRQATFRFILATMMLPSFLMLIPNFVIMVNFPLVGGNNILGQGGQGGMITNIFSLILPFAVSGFGIFLMRQFIMGLPIEVIEAARIDGASEGRIFFNVILPQTTPIALSLGLLTFVNSWNEYIWPSIIGSSNNNLMTLPVGIQMLQSAYDPARSMPVVMAGIVMSMLPILIVFLIFQKYYVRGVAMSGMKW